MRVMYESRTTLSEAEKRDWLRLIRTDNVGPISFFQLLARFGSAGAALEALPELARKGGGKRIRIAQREVAARELEAAAAADARVIGYPEPGWRH